MSGLNVGDVVECINDEPCPVMGIRDTYRRGRVYRVVDIKHGYANNGNPASGLKAAGHEHELHRNVICFRKIDAPESEIANRIRAARPLYAQVPA